MNLNNRTKLSTLFLVICLWAFTPSKLYALDIKFLGNNPQCKSYSNLIKNAYCTWDDLDDVVASTNNHPVHELLEELNHPLNNSVIISTMSFSHEGVTEALCRLQKNGASVKIIYDRHQKSRSLARASQCGITMIPRGASKETQETDGGLYHAKFVYITRPHESVVWFGSGNFSKPSLSINHEIWGLVKGEPEDPFFKDHDCHIKLIEQMRSSYECHHTDARQISLVFVPFNKDLERKLLVTAAFSKRIWMASNRYNFSEMNYDLIKRIGNYDARLILDDDIYWASKLPSSQYSPFQLDAKSVSRIENTKVQVRYLQTSFKSVQKMHSKFIVFDDKALVGAGNLTVRGLNLNYENFYWIEDPILVEELANQYKYLWNLGLSRDQMPKSTESGN